MAIGGGTVPVGSIYSSLLAVVLIQVLIGGGAVGGTIGLIVQMGFRRRFLFYLYEFGLLLQYLHYLVPGPPQLGTGLASIAYWAVLFGCWPLLVAPILLEWGTWRRHRSGLQEQPRRVGRCVLYALGASVLLSLCFAGLFCAVAHVLRSSAV